MRVHVGLCLQRPDGSPLELELQDPMSHLMSVLGNELGSTATAVFNVTEPSLPKFYLLLIIVVVIIIILCVWCLFYTCRGQRTTEWNLPITFL